MIFTGRREGSRFTVGDGASVTAWVASILVGVGTSVVLSITVGITVVGVGGTLIVGCVSLAFSSKRTMYEGSIHRATGRSNWGRDFGKTIRTFGNWDANHSNGCSTIVI